MTGDGQALAIEAGERLAGAYRTVDERMRGLPVHNPALGVEAVGFRASGGAAVGVVATPWFMNLVRVALPGSPLPDATPGLTIPFECPAGAVDLVVGDVPGFGRVDAASLFSPMEMFDDPAVVRLVAEAALDALFAPPAEAAPAPSRPRLDRRGFLGLKAGAAAP